MIKDLQLAKNPKAALGLIKKGYAPMAGGTEINRLNSTVKATSFVSLKNVGLKEIEMVDGLLKIGAMCTFTELLKSKDVPEALKKALRFCESMQKRNSATIGGNVALAGDDSYLVSTLTAYDAVLEFEGESGKNVSLLEWLFQEKKKPQLIAYIYIDPQRKVVSNRISRTASSRALLTASVGGTSFKDLKGSVAVKGVGITDLNFVLEALKDDGKYNEEHVKEALTASSILPFKSDKLYGSKNYKLYIFTTVVDELIKEFAGLVGGAK